MPPRKAAKYIVPTTEQVGVEVASILRENDSAKPREIHRSILKNHKDWKLTERFVRRCVKAKRKKQKKLQEESVGDGSVVKRFFSRRRSSTRAPESAPRKSNKPLFPAYEIEDPSAEEVILPSPGPQAAAPPEPPEVDDAIAVYEDDNDGKKERGPCTPCEGCVIL